MTVIVLTASSPDPSVVTSSEAFDREGTAILIRNADLAQLNDNKDDCNTSYDLRVGQIFRDHRRRYGQELGQSDQIHLLPGNAVIIETEEWVEFPKWRCGQILPKVTLLQEGIANTPSKVDPGYRGNLLITTFNHGKRMVTLSRGQRFCLLHVFDVVGPVRLYDKPPKRIGGVPRSASWRQQFHDWIDANGATVDFIQTAAIVGSLVVAVLALAHK